MADLTTLANLRGWLGANANVTTDDSVLTRLITSVSARIETYCSRKFLTASYSEAYDGKDTPAIALGNFPITAVASLSVDGVSISAAPAPSQAGFVFSDTMLSLNGYRFSRGYQNVLVAYTAGYAANAVPGELEQACIDWCSLRYRERERIGHRSKTIGGETVAYVVGDMPDSVKGALGPFRRVTPR